MMYNPTIRVSSQKQYGYALNYSCSITPILVGTNCSNRLVCKMGVIPYIRRNPAMCPKRMYLKYPRVRLARQLSNLIGFRQHRKSRHLSIQQVMKKKMAAVGYMIGRPPEQRNATASTVSMFVQRNSNMNSAPVFLSSQSSYTSILVLRRSVEQPRSQQRPQAPKHWNPRFDR